MDELISLISNVGFPITITAYLMLRFETKIDKLNQNILDLTIMIEKLKN